MKKQLFVLGGNDGEMTLIKTLLNMAGKFTIQPKTDWGNHLYAPADVKLEVREVVSGFSKYYYNGTPIEEVVFVECFPATGAWEQSQQLRVNISIVDHHAGDSWEAASVMQVLRDYASDVVISEAMRRMVELSAANDTGYIPAMEALFASPQEIAAVRKADRQAQGITPAHEVEAERAIAEAVTEARLTIVKMAHSKSATVADRLYGSYENLLILSADGEVNFFGNGALCATLKKKFEGGNGGAGLGKPNESAFWVGYPNQKEVLDFIKSELIK